MLGLGRIFTIGLLSAAIGSALIPSSAKAGDWAEFFKAHSAKQIIVSWDQQTFDDKTNEPPVIHREFTYQIKSPTMMERAGRETDAATGALLNSYSYNVVKSEPLMASGERFRFQTIDVQDSMIINGFYDRGALFSELRIFVGPTHCTAAFTVDTIEDEAIKSRARSVLKCSVVALKKPAVAAPAKKPAAPAKKVEKPKTK